MARNVVRLIQQRLLHLSPLAMQVVRCAAVAGQDADARLVARVLGTRPLDLADAWSELEAAQVFRDGHFVHDLIAEAAPGIGATGDRTHLAWRGGRVAAAPRT